MDEQLRKRIVGLVTLGIVAVVLSWLLPRPGLESLSGEAEQVISIDLVEPEQASQEDLIAMSTAAQNLPSTDSEAGLVDDTADRDEPDQQARRHKDSAEVAETSDPEPSPKGASDNEPGQADKPEARPGPDAVDAPKPEPEPSKEVAVAAPAKPRAPEPAKSDGGHFFVQAGAFSQLDSAREMQARCNLQGLECKLLPTDSSQGTLYRVRCGPYDGRGKAENARSRLAGAGIKSSLVASGG